MSDGEREIVLARLAQHQRVDLGHRARQGGAAVIG
jgi:hypothetical protein